MILRLGRKGSQSPCDRSKSEHPSVYLRRANLIGATVLGESRRYTKFSLTVAGRAALITRKRKMFKNLLIPLPAQELLTPTNENFPSPGQTAGNRNSRAICAAQTACYKHPKEEVCPGRSGAQTHLKYSPIPWGLKPALVILY